MDNAEETIFQCKHELWKLGTRQDLTLPELKKLKAPIMERLTRAERTLARERETLAVVEELDSECSHYYDGQFDELSE